MKACFKILSCCLLSVLFIPSVLSQELPEVSVKLNSLPQNVEQVILIYPTTGVFHAQLSTYEKKDGLWQAISNPIEAVIGRNGLAAEDAKREGDGHTPSGIFSLERAFGYHPEVTTQLNYKQVDETDLWVDDAASFDYNLWVKAPTQAASFERLKRDDDLYEYAVVVEYNTRPVVPGMGSAIFLHVWRSTDSPTAGCVAISKEHLVALLEWLDKERNPVMMVGE